MANRNDYPTYEELNNNNSSPYYQQNVYPSSQQSYFNKPQPNAGMNEDMVDSTHKYEELYVDTNHMNSKAMMRAGFITKVYGILAFQLTITVISISFIFIPQVEAFFKTPLALSLAYVSILGALLTIILLSCIRPLARRVPINYVLLTLFTVFESYLLQLICLEYEPHSVIIAGIITAAVTITLALYALKTKEDYTSCGAFLFCCITILFFGSIISIFWRNYFFETLCACVGIVVYSIYLIYDIQLISGKFGREFDIEDYVMASMNVYLDIINLFVKILQLLGNKKRK